MIFNDIDDCLIRMVITLNLAAFGCICGSLLLSYADSVLWKYFLSPQQHSDHHLWFTPIAGLQLPCHLFMMGITEQFRALTLSRHQAQVLPMCSYCLCSVSLGCSSTTCLAQLCRSLDSSISSEKIFFFNWELYLIWVQGHPPGPPGSSM